jgi:hypothetical protein
LSACLAYLSDSIGAPVAAAATADIIMPRAPLTPPSQPRGGTRWDQRRGKALIAFLPRLGSLSIPPNQLSGKDRWTSRLKPS